MFIEYPMHNETGQDITLYAFKKIKWVLNF